MDHVILNHGQVTWTTPELAPPLLTTTPHQREDVSAFDRFSVHRCPTRRVFSGTGLELLTMPATIRYLYHSATAASKCFNYFIIFDDGRSMFATEVEEIVDLSEPMNSDSDAEIDNETPIKTVNFLMAYIVWKL
ncbi:uncharacterized protein TNCV_1651881 [Trichonephila clavipes]|nr:uncharacterized protein TNCV_1651881 [Trichonephila clavipes]